jgi:uncharacterized surface protein with fasciclin (FAS1) repeats
MLLFAVMALLVAVVSPAGAQSVLKEQKEPTIMKYLVDSAPEYAIMVKLANASRLTETFEGPGPMTMFAPVNKAFEVMPAGTVDNLLKPEMIDSLKRTLTSHVIAGNWPLKDLEQKIKEAGGEFEVPAVGGSGKLTFVMEQGRVVLKDQRGYKTPLGQPVITQNGMVYRIDKILLR